jgi:glycine/serine hydroxymethyltransferase
MKEREMTKVAEYIDTVLKNKDDEKIIKRVREEIKEFTSSFPIPGINI